MSLTTTIQDHQALLEAYLRALGLPMFLQLYQSYAQGAARSGLSFERFLLALCEAEVADREARRIEAAIKRAKLPFLKEIAEYDFAALETISKTTFLELAQGGYMSNAENLILVGNPGLGKTHLAIGLALAACRQEKRVRFYKTAALINDLQVAQKKLTLSGFVAGFAKLDLLILDELGFIAVDKAGGQLLFQLVSDLSRKNGWQLAEHAGEARPDGMQRLLSSAVWDTDGVRDDLCHYVVEQLGRQGGRDRHR